MGGGKNRRKCRHCTATRQGQERWYTVDPLDPLPALAGREGCWDHCPTHQRDWVRRKAAAAEALALPAASGAPHRLPLAPRPASEPLFAPFAPPSARPLAAIHVPEALFPPPPLPPGSAAAGGQPLRRTASEELRKSQAAARLLQAADIGTKVLDSKMLDGCTIEELLDDAEFGRRVKAADEFLRKDGVVTDHDKKFFANIHVIEMLVPLGPLGSSSSQHRRTPEIVL